MLINNGTCYEECGFKEISLLIECLMTKSKMAVVLLCNIVWWDYHCRLTLTLNYMSSWSTGLCNDISNRGTKTKLMPYFPWLVHVKLSLPQWMLERELNWNKKYICIHVVITFGFTFCVFANSLRCTYNLKSNTCAHLQLTVDTYKATNVLSQLERKRPVKAKEGDTGFMCLFHAINHCPFTVFLFPWLSIPLVFVGYFIV